MTQRTFETSPQGYARTAGAIYLLVILFGLFSEGVVMNTLVVSGDMPATARRIAAAPDLWRLSTAGDLIVPVIAVVQLWIEYLLLRPAGKNTALLFVLFNAASLAVELVSKVFLLMIAPMVTPALGVGGHAAPADHAQLYALARFALSAHNISFNIALILFGCACLVSGHLIFRSRYLPRLVGLLMQLAGACYLVASFAELFAPALADLMTPWILLPPLIGESSFCLWLLVRGVNVARWNERLSAGGLPEAA